MNNLEIINALELSTFAYRQIQPYGKHICTAMIDNKESDVQCFIRKYKDTIWITFRGSDSHKDWLTNLAFAKKTLPYDNTESKIKVHSGFINAYKTPGVRDKILDFITDDIHYIKVCGHSLGAALSVLCAVDIEYNFPNRDIEALLFGCPRVGNKAFAKSYNKRVSKTIRVENSNDIVTKIPFSIWGYRHVGAKLHIGVPRILGCYCAHNHYPHEYYSSLLSKLL